MAVLDITEYQFIARDGRGSFVPTGMEPALTTQQLAIGAGSVASNAFNENTTLVRIHADAPCRIEINPAPTASAASKRMAAGQTEYFGVRAGHKVAVITTT